MYNAHKAKLNVGIITTIFASTPLFTSICDYLVYGETLFMSHFIAVILMLLSSLIIGLSDILMPSPQEAEAVVSQIPVYIPVLYGLCVPVCFMCTSMLMKHLTSAKVGFDSFTVSFGTTSACSLIMQLIGILWYW